MYLSRYPGTDAVRRCLADREDDGVAELLRSDRHGDLRAALREPVAHHSKRSQLRTLRYHVMVIVMAGTRNT